MKKFLAFVLTTLMVLSACTMTFAATEVTVKVDGKVISSDVAPQIISGRTMVPLRAIFEALGATVAWNDSTRTVTAVKGNDVVNCTIDSYVMLVNGVEKALDVAPMIVNSRTLVPARFVAEAFGCNVAWDGEKRLVTITSKATCYPGTDIPSFTGVTKIPSKDVFSDDENFIFNEYEIQDLDDISNYIDALLADGWTVYDHNESDTVMRERYKKGKSCVAIWLHISGYNIDSVIAVSYNTNFFDE